MSSVTIELYDALKSAGASEEAARKAAEAVAESKEVATKANVERLRVKMLEMKIDLVKWMAGLMVAQSAIVLTVVGWMLSSVQ